MDRRLLVAVALAAAAGPALAELPPRGFDPPNHTWAATHIVLVEGETVIESWKGDLKPGARLPDGAAAYARIRPPAFDRGWLAAAGDAPGAVSGKRMVLFLAHVPEYRWEERGPVWMGADRPGFPTHPPAAGNVAWVEGDRVYHVGGWGHGWWSGLGSTGGVAGLREQVGLGLALRARFEAAQAERDPGRRAERLVALAPVLTAYADLWPKHDAVEAVGGCGAAGVPHLAGWATDPGGRFRSEAWGALCRTGDAGADAVLKVLDAEAAYWARVSAGLKPGRTVRDLPADPLHPWGSPNGLYHLLSGVRAMRLSADNQRRVRGHPGLAEVDRLLANHPGMKPAKSDMEEAHRVLRQILAGEFHRDD